MKKKLHQQPEFTLIQRSQANAKFFVASGDGGGFTSTDTGGNGSATQYGTGDGLSM